MCSLQRRGRISAPLQKPLLHGARPTAMASPRVSKAAARKLGHGTCPHSRSNYNILVRLVERPRASDLTVEVLQLPTQVGAIFEEKRQEYLLLPEWPDIVLVGLGVGGLDH